MRGVDEIDFGFAKIWNFSRRSHRFIPDLTVRQHIDKILRTYQDQHGRVSDIGVVSLEGKSYFERLTPGQFSMIREAKLILFLSFVSKNNTRTGINDGHQKGTSENFSEIYQNFVVGEEYTAESDGYLVPSVNWGLKLGDFTRLRPGHVPNPLGFSHEEQLLSSILKLRAHAPLIYYRVLNAVEVFFESYLNTISLSTNARILLQSSAFEILLQLGDRRQRKKFKEQVEAATTEAEDRKYRYAYEKSPGHSKGLETRNIKGIWADRFYTLRNHIVHGNVPDPAEYQFSYYGETKQRHTDLALLFFLLLVKRRIQKR